MCVGRIANPGHGGQIYKAHLPLLAFPLPTLIQPNHDDTWLIARCFMPEFTWPDNIQPYLDQIPLLNRRTDTCADSGAFPTRMCVDSLDRTATGSGLVSTIKLLSFHLGLF